MAWGVTFNPIQAKDRMIGVAVRSAFETMVASGRGDAGALAAGLRREMTGVGLRSLAAKMLHVAVCAPNRLDDVYDSAAEGWRTGRRGPTPATRNTSEDHTPEAFWDAFWELLDQPAATRKRKPFTVATMRLAGLLDPQVEARVSAAAAGRPGVRDAAAAGRSDRIEAGALSGYGASTLGGAVHREITLKGELGKVLDTPELGLAGMPPPLDYLNKRALECHLMWAAVGGYSHAELDELALAAFQAGQFGHHYSTLLLGLTMATVAFDRPQGAELVLDSIFAGWRHGRETPLLLNAPWSEMWDLPLEAVRQRLRVKPFASPLSAAIARAAAQKGRPDAAE